MKHIIIGGVAGGATAAARIRRTDEKAEIFLLEKGKYMVLIYISTLENLRKAGVGKSPNQSFLFY